MFGWTRKERNQKLADTLNVPYDDGVYVQTLKGYGLKPMSLEKFGRRLIAREGLYGAYVDAAGEVTEEVTNTQRLTDGYASRLPKYLEAMSRATGNEIVEAGCSMHSTALPYGSGWAGEFNFALNG